MRPAGILRSAQQAGASRLQYAIGLSYASKASPPFVPANSQPEPYGFAGQPTKLGRWVDGMLNLRAGRGELSGGVEGGWTDVMQVESKRWGAGEDFFALVDNGGYTHLAVSDGVGGWAGQADPSLFSQALMQRYSQAASAAPSAAPWDLLRKGYEGVLEEVSVAMGSATAVSIGLSESGELRGVNLGDSGLLIMRKDQPIYETPVQTHYFNCPLQLTKAPASQSAGLAKDLPEHGFRFQTTMAAGDVAILFTDGLSDNVPLAHIALLANRVTELLANPQNAHLSPTEHAAERARLLADVFVGYARLAMQRTGQEKTSDGKPAWKTPFEEEAAKHGYKYLGGKVDDRYLHNPHPQRADWADGVSLQAHLHDTGALPLPYGHRGSFAEIMDARFSHHGPASLVIALCFRPTQTAQRMTMAPPLRTYAGAIRTDLD